jgi:hypothetical protein
MRKEKVRRLPPALGRSVSLIAKVQVFHFFFHGLQYLKKAYPRVSWNSSRAQPLLDDFLLPTQLGTSRKCHF